MFRFVEHASVSSFDSKFVKGVSIQSSNNSEDHVFGLYGNTIAPEPVKAHIPPKVVGLKLLKDSKEKEPDVAENPTV